MFDKSPLQIRISGPDDEAKPLIDAVNSLLLPQKILIRAKLDGYGYSRRLKEPSKDIGPHQEGLSSSSLRATCGTSQDVSRRLKTSQDVSRRLKEDPDG